MYRHPYQKFISVLNQILILLSLVAVASLIAEYGFYISPGLKHLIHRIDVFIVWFFVLQAAVKLVAAEERWNYFKSRWFDYLLVGVILIGTVVILSKVGFQAFGKFLYGRRIVEITKLYIIGAQISIVLSLFAQGIRLNQRIAMFPFHPAQILMASFLIIILVGSLLLMLPKAVQPGKHLSYLDALFTATSATCVTGLIVVDTGQHFSRLGQLIILTLIQIGGLGLMTYATFFAFVLRRNISLREKSLMADILNYESMGLIVKLLYTTIIFTFLVEFIGAVIFFFGFGSLHPALGERIFSAIFHSVSAFCNAGFSLYSTSFMQFNQSFLVVLTLAILIISGGIGFPVILNITGYRAPLGGKIRRVQVQTRLVLLITAGLLVAGTAFFLLAENNGTLAGQPWHVKLLNAFFQSVTTRTAGFNTVDISQIAVPTALFFLLLMFIGASPGSTGGGIKTTTIGILFAGVWNVIRGRNRIELFKKRIPNTVLNRALVILLFSTSFVFVGILILSFTESKPLLDIIFEEFSAFGTVGLSRGITPDLSTWGKMVIIATMYFGRLGALTISLAITTPREIYHYDYPSESVMVG